MKIINGKADFFKDSDNGEVVDKQLLAVFDDLSLCLDEYRNDLTIFDHGKCRDRNRSTSCDAGSPHDGLLFALHYMKSWDLLLVERVCKGLRDAVRNDPSLWRTVEIVWPLRGTITDEALFRLTSRAQGALQCLSLSWCVEITDIGLQRVLETNPMLTKLSLLGCCKLSSEGLLQNLKAFKSVSKSGIKHLRVGRYYGVDVTKELVEELKSVLDAHNDKPRFSHIPDNPDDRSLDNDICPRCQEVRMLVYDCPKHHSKGSCRACLACIPRCCGCGCCHSDQDLHWKARLNSLCLDCWKQYSRKDEKEKEACNLRSHLQYFELLVPR